MRKYYVLALISLCMVSYSQESFKKRFKIPPSIQLKKGGVVVLQKEKEIKYKDFNKKEKDSIDDFFKKGSSVSYTIERIISGNKVLVDETVIVDEKFYNKQKIKKNVAVDSNTVMIGYVKFEGDKVYVNPFLVVNDDDTFIDKGTYFYQLKNRQKIKLKFTEATVSALIIPIKYRFQDGAQNLKEEFSTAANVNLFGGFSYGSTSFFYQDKVGNISNTWKFTLGLILGASSVKLDNSNTSNAESPIPDDVEITKGLASMGVGLTFSFNKINIGTFYGWDYCIGQDSDKWNYNKKPWLGIALGYSLFTL